MLNNIKIIGKGMMCLKKRRRQCDRIIRHTAYFELERKHIVKERTDQLIRTYNFFFLKINENDSISLLLHIVATPLGH
jgi:hypothetical protein